jgi:hypothetical protein
VYHGVLKFVLGVHEVNNIASEQISESPLAMSIKGRPLSDRQVAIMSFVEEYVQEHPYPPSIRDISRGVGISSTSNVSYHINRLIEQGYLSKQPGTSRTLVALSPDYQPNDDPVSPDWKAERVALRAENRRLREWCRQLERERMWERQQRQEPLAG